MIRITVIERVIDKYLRWRLLFQPNINASTTGNKLLKTINGGPKKFQTYLKKSVCPKKKRTDSGGFWLHWGSTTDIMYTVPPTQILTPITDHQRKKLKRFFRHFITYKFWIEFIFNFTVLVNNIMDLQIHYSSLNEPYI